MSHAKALYQWQQRVATFFADLPHAGAGATGGA